MASTRNKLRSKSSATTGVALRDRFFTIAVKLLPTNEFFEIKKVSNEMKISELKKEVEFATGIPYHMQRLRYLDEADLQEHTYVRKNDIIPGAILHLGIWNEWRSLVEAVAANDCDDILKLGVTQDTQFSTPNSEYLGKSAKEKWISERAFTALYIAAHRGFMKMVNKLIEKGANVNGRTSAGRTPLHVAAAQGHGTVVDLLLEKGADIDAEDRFGDSALAIAGKYGHKGCERHLFLFRWQERAKTMKPHKERGLFPHQHFDSSFPIWLRGYQGQLYFVDIKDQNDNGPSQEKKRNTEDPLVNSEKDHHLRSNSAMSVIQEEMSNRSVKSASSAKNKIDPFYAWLKRKQKAEQIIIDRQRQQDEIKRLEEKERLAVEAAKEREKEHSYETWLDKGDTAKQKSAVAAKPQNAEPTKSKRQASVTAIIEDIVKRRQEEAIRANKPEPALTFESWLVPEQDIIEDIRLGKTPLQRNLTTNL